MEGTFWPELGGGGGGGERLAEVQYGNYMHVCGDLDMDSPRVEILALDAFKRFKQRLPQRQPFIVVRCLTPNITFH